MIVVVHVTGVTIQQYNNPTICYSIFKLIRTAELHNR